MSGYLPIGGGGAGGSSTVSTVSAIAEDMFFSSNNGRDIWTSGNPDRLYSGVACAVGSGGVYDYYMWDVQAGEWRDANLIYQGAKGDKGDKGDSGSVEAVTGVSMDIALGTISTTLTKQSGETISSIPVVLPEADAIESVENTYSNNQLTTKITTESGAQFESSPVTIESGAGGASLKSASHDVFNGALQTTYTLTDDSTVKSNAIELPTGGSVSIDAPDNTMVKVVDGVLVAAGVTEVDGTIEVSPQSVKIGAHKLSSVGDALGVQNEATEQQRVLIFQDMDGGITKRPYVYRMTSDTAENQETIPDATGVVTKAFQSIDGFVTEGYYIIDPNSISFEFDEPQTDYVFTVYDLSKKIFEGKYSQVSSTSASVEHGALIVDGVADISFSVTDLNGDPIALKGSSVLDVQKFVFKMRTAERAYLAYEGEGGSGGEYPKNPVFETVQLDMFAGSEANKNINFLSDDLTITNGLDGQGVKIEGDHVTLSSGESDVVLDADALNLGFKELINIQAGNAATSAVNLAQVESMLKNLFLQRVEVTLNDNTLPIDQQYAGKNVFVRGAGLDSQLTLNADDFEDYQVVQVTRSADYDNPAIPILITQPDRDEIRFLVQGTTTFGIYDNQWLVLSDATVTLAEVAQRFLGGSASQQYVRVQAGQGMTSSIDRFGVMTLDVVGGSGTDINFDFPDGTIVQVQDEKPAASPFREVTHRFVSDAGLVVGGHTIQSAGEPITINDQAIVAQGINSFYEYSNPKIYRETLSSSTHLTVNSTNQSYAYPDGQQVSVSGDYSHLRIHKDTLHFQPNQVGSGYIFTILDNHLEVVFKHVSDYTFSAISTVYVEAAVITLHCNKDYMFIVTDLDGNPITLKGSGGIQKFAFDFTYLDESELITADEISLPDDPRFEHVKTLRVSDLTNAAGLTFNSAGFIESDCNVSLDGHQLISVGDATALSHAPNLAQVNKLISEATFQGSIAIDGQEVEAITLNEDDFAYHYNEFTKVLSLSVISNGGGGGGNADGTVNPVVSENMENFLVEFANADGTLIRSANTTSGTLMTGIANANEMADSAKSAAIAADATAGTALAATATNSGILTKHSLELDRMRLEIDANSAATLRNGRSITQTRREADATQRGLNSTQRDVHILQEHAGEVDSAIAQLGEINETQNTGIAELQDDYVSLQGEVQGLSNLNLDRIARGEFEETVSIADSFDTLSTHHYVTPYGSEVEYALPPDARTSEPAYTVNLKVDGQTHEALKLTTTAIRAGMKPIKDLVDGVDAQDAVTVNQLVPIHEAITNIHDRLSVIEAMLDIISPPPDEFPVYVGRMIDETTNSAEVIKGLGQVDGVTASTLLATDYVVQGHEETAENPFSFSVIAYPKGVVDPDPFYVKYDVVPKADREHYEIVIDGVMYIVLHNKYPDSSANPISYKLVQ